MLKGSDPPGCSFSFRHPLLACWFAKFSCQAKITRVKNRMSTGGHGHHLARRRHCCDKGHIMIHLITHGSSTRSSVDTAAGGASPCGRGAITRLESLQSIDLLFPGRSSWYGARRPGFDILRNRCTLGNSATLPACGRSVFLPSP